MITRIKKQHALQYEFFATRSEYVCESRKSLAEIRKELLRQHIRLKGKII